MRNGHVTDPSHPGITPVVYIDLDISPSPDTLEGDLGPQADLITAVNLYPGLKSLLLTARGPGGGNPVYRIEGALPQLVKWLKGEYGAGTTGEPLSFYLSRVMLAR